MKRINQKYANPKGLRRFERLTADVETWTTVSTPPHVNGNWSRSPPIAISSWIIRPTLVSSRLQNKRRPRSRRYLEGQMPAQDESNGRRPPEALARTPGP